MPLRVRTLRPGYGVEAQGLAVGLVCSTVRGEEVKHLPLTRERQVSIELRLRDRCPALVDAAEGKKAS